MKKTLKIMLFRMWAAGAVCFFAAWGRAAPQDSEMENVAAAFSFNLITGLIIVMILCDMLIVNPIIRLVEGKRLLGERKGIMSILWLPLNIVKVTALILLVVVTYYFINTSFIRIFAMDEKSVPVPLEPVLFGVFYGLYWLLFEITGKFLNGRFYGKPVS